MLRSISLLVLSVVLAGCQSRYGCGPFSSCGSRVPPPATGSYGAPNTYYPMVPRTSAVEGGPRAFDSGLSNWRSVEDGETTLAASPSSPPGGAFTSNEPVGTSVRVASHSPPSPAPTTRSSASSLRLKGMPVSEVKPAVVPASHSEPVDDSGSGAAVSGATIRATPAAEDRPSNRLRSDETARAESWQTRAAPAPTRAIN